MKKELGSMKRDLVLARTRRQSMMRDFFVLQLFNELGGMDDGKGTSFLFCESFAEMQELSEHWASTSCVDQKALLFRAQNMDQVRRTVSMHRFAGAFFVEEW